MNPALSIEELIKAWKTDSALEADQVLSELLKIPNLHAKYAEQWVAHTVAKNKKIRELKKLRIVKTDYYKGILPQEDLKKYKWQPHLKSNKKKDDLVMHMEADEDLQNVEEQINTHEICIGYLNSIIKSVEHREWTIRTFVEHKKFEHGLR